MSHYDAVVVGAGNGGLTAAVTLAQSGLKVLMIEKHNIPGGCATSFCRGRFEFDVSLHQFGGMGTEEMPGPLRQILAPMGVMDRIELVDEENLFTVEVEGEEDISLPADPEKVIETLSQKFPEHREGIEKYIKFINDYTLELVAVTMEGAPDPTPEKFPLFFKYSLRDTKSVFDEFFDDEFLQKCIMSPYLCYVGLPADKLPFAGFCLPPWELMLFKPKHIIGGSQALSNALIDCFKEAGGEVKFNCGVEKIIVEDGKVQGVVTDDGQAFSTNYVVSNASSVDTYMKFIDRSQVPQEVIDDLNSKELSVSAVTLYIGLDCAPSELDMSASMTFLFDDTCEAKDAVFGTPFKKIDSVGISCYTNTDQSFSPVGTTTLSVVNVQYGKDWQSIPAHEYHDTKNRIAGEMLDLIGKFYPGFREHIEEIEIATPLTHMNYLSTPGGAIYGFSPYAKDLPFFCDYGHPTVTPINGLFIVGASVTGGGYPLTLMSGVQAANLLIAQFNGQELKFPSNEFLKQIEGYDLFGKDVTKASRTIETDMELQSTISSKLVQRIHDKNLTLKISQITDEVDDVKTIRLVRDHGFLPSFIAGQYINLSVNIDGVTTSRPYSISSAPSQAAYYDITVQRTDGGFVSPYLLDVVKVGDEFGSTSPAGEFYYQPVHQGDDLVMLAGGSGVTPMISMIRQFTSMGSKSNIHLIYVSRTPDHVICSSELETLDAQYDNFTFTKLISRPADDYQGLKGRISAELISSIVEDIPAKTYYICGPTGMCNSAKADLLSLGVKARKIRQENFGESTDITQKADWPESVNKASHVKVKVVGGSDFEAPVGEPLLNSLDRAGISVPASCHAGECSLCRVRLVKGNVYTLPGSKERVSDKKYGYIHSCSSYPTGDIEIEVN